MLFMSLFTNSSLAQSRYISYDDVIIINSNGIVTDVLKLQSKIEFTGDRAVVKLNNGTIMNRMYNWKIKGKGNRTGGVKFTFADENGYKRNGMLSNTFLLYSTKNKESIMLVPEGHGIRVGKKMK